MKPQDLAKLRKHGIVQITITPEADALLLKHEAMAQYKAMPFTRKTFHGANIGGVLIRVHGNEA